MAPLTRDEMETILRRILEVDRELKHFHDLERANAVPHAHAARDSVQRLEAVLPFELPASYVQMLGIVDGVDNFYWVDNDLLSSSYLLDHPDYSRHWERPEMFFFIMGDDWEAVAFDTANKDTDGEMEVVEFDRNTEDMRWPSLSDFLIGYKERLEDWLARARADRAQTDDE